MASHSTPLGGDRYKHPRTPVSLCYFSCCVSTNPAHGAVSLSFLTCFLLIFSSMVLHHEPLTTSSSFVLILNRPIATAQRRRLLLADDCMTEHSSWGHLSDAQQMLLSYRANLNDSERLELSMHLHDTNVHVAGYLPDHTLVVVGSKLDLTAAANHSSVVYATYHEPDWKIAPEWEPVLTKIEETVETVRSAASHMGGANATAVMAAMLSASLARLPVHVFHDDEFVREPRVGIRVTFPSTVGPSPHAVSHPRSSLSRSFFERQSNSHAGQAACEDWGPALKKVFGDRIEVHSSGSSAAVVVCPLDCLRDVIDWLVVRPAVHWVEPVARKMTMAHEASAVMQSSLPATNDALDPATRPFWAAGITGKGQVVGIGDSGLDVDHCFFTDAVVPFPGSTKTINGVRTFVSDLHRKIVLYQAFADFKDVNGHGTHTSGTLAGFPYGEELKNAGSQNIGMAPDAKIAFLDLSGGSDSRITTPYDLARDYFGVTSIVGAQVHSDSWGSDSTKYDEEAAMIDDFCWKNPEFFSVFPSGNAGNYGTMSGQSTVNSPATAKNIIAAGATLSTYEKPTSNTYDDFVWMATISVDLWKTSYRVLQSNFSPSFSSIKDKAFPMAAAEPLDGCSPFTGQQSHAGAVSLIERGGCNFDVKARNAEQAGAAAVLIFDFEAGAYFVPSSTGSRSQIPVAMIPRRQGRNALAILNSGREADVKFSDAPDALSLYGFEDLAEFSSQGPVAQDKRVKPDLVAPGTIASAEANTNCGIVVYGGTSMSTPVIAGGGIMLRQYFMDGFYPSGVANAADAFTPSAALLKAVLVAGASSLQGFEADTGLPIDPPPSFRQGFGRVDLGNSVPLQVNPNGPKRVQLLDKVLIVTGETHRYCLNAKGGPVSIAIVWTDLPAKPSASKHLVNDLDLVVRATGLNGERLIGNGGDVENPNLPDAVNNVETVELPPGPPGRFSVEVLARNVQDFGGPQPYAIVVNGDFEGDLVTPSEGTAVECDVVSVVILSGPEEITNSSSIEFELGTTSGNSQGVVFECQLKYGEGDNANFGASGTFDWTVCRSSVVLNNLQDGAYSFAARIQGDQTIERAAFKKDTVPPSVKIQRDEQSPGLLAAFNFQAENEDAAVDYKCRIKLAEGSPLQESLLGGTWTAKDFKLGEWHPCASPMTVGWLQPGQWTFEVQGQDTAGNVAKAPASHAWKLARSATQQTVPTIFNGPFLEMPRKNVVFKVGAMDPSATQLIETPLRCGMLDGDQSQNPNALSNIQWQQCSGSINFGSLADGAHTFYVALGSAGNAIDQNSFVATSFIVDGTAPFAEFVSNPTQLSSVDSLTFEFSLSEEGATAMCE